MRGDDQVTTTTDEHVAFCKRRARAAYKDALSDGLGAAAARDRAVASMVADLGKHPGTRGFAWSAKGLADAMVRDEATLNDFIDGF